MKKILLAIIAALAFVNAKAQNSVEAGSVLQTSHQIYLKNPTDFPNRRLYIFYPNNGGANRIPVYEDLNKYFPIAGGPLKGPLILDADSATTNPYGKTIFLNRKTNYAAIRYIALGDTINPDGNLVFEFGDDPVKRNANGILVQRNVGGLGYFNNRIIKTTWVVNDLFNQYKGYDELNASHVSYGLVYSQSVDSTNKGRLRVDTSLLQTKSGAASNYIKNQNSSAQNANAWISGNLTANSVTAQHINTAIQSGGAALDIYGDSITGLNFVKLNGPYIESNGFHYFNQGFTVQPGKTGEFGGRAIFRGRMDLVGPNQFMIWSDGINTNYWKNQWDGTDLIFEKEVNGITQGKVILTAGGNIKDQSGNFFLKQNPSTFNVGDSTVRAFAAFAGSSEVIAVGRANVLSPSERFSFKLSRRYGLAEGNYGRGARYLQDITATDSSIYNQRNGLIPTYVPGSLLFIEMTVNDPQGDTTLYTIAAYTPRLTTIANNIVSKGWPANRVKFFNPGYWNSLSQARHGSIPYRHGIYATAMQSVATTYGFQFIDLYADMKAYNDTYKTLLFSDSLHYTSAGHSWIDSAMYSKISPTIPVVDQTPSVFNVFKSLTTTGDVNVGRDVNVKGIGNITTINSTTVTSPYLIMTSTINGSVGYQPEIKWQSATVQQSNNVNVGVMTGYGWSQQLGRYLGRAAYEMTIDGTPSGNVMPIKHVFSTSDISGGRIDRVVINANGGVSIGTGTKNAKLSLGGSTNVSSGGTVGVVLNTQTVTMTDTVGTSETRVGGITFNAVTFASRNAKTISDAATFMINGPAAAGTNTTITRVWSFWNNSGNSYFGGSAAFGVTSPTAVVHIKAGTTTAGTAPLKYTSGPLNTTAEVGAQEFLTDKLYTTITTGAARKEYTLNDVALNSSIVPGTTTNGRLTNTAVTVTELGYLTGVTSSIQTQLNNTNTVSSAATLTLTTGGWYTFSGATSTWTLPTVASSSNVVYRIKNRGSNTLTINSSAGGNDIYFTSAVNTISISPGDAVIIHNDGVFFDVQ